MRHDRTFGLNGSLGDEPPAPEAFAPALAGASGCATRASSAARAISDDNDGLTYQLYLSVGTDQISGKEARGCGGKEALGSD